MSPIYLFSHLCQYELILNYFIISVIIHYCFISFVAQIIPVLATGKGTQLAPMSLRYIALLWCFVSLCVCFVCFICLVLPYFLALQEALEDSGSSFVFPVPVLESAVYPKIPASYYWIIVLEIKIWALCMLFVPCQFITTYYSVCKFLNLKVIAPIKFKHRYKLNVYSYIQISLQ